ncbi:MAG: alpha/beta hydrolase [Anaerolineae bacterium]
MSAVVIDGSLVHYEALGRGRPVLFIHGWLGSWRYWLPSMEAIAAKHRAYALDLWGFGDSDKSRPRYGVPDYTALLDNFLKYLGIEQLTLVGHALGASVALEYTVQHPERVERLMAVSLPVTADSISRRLLDFAHSSVLGKLMRRWQISHKEVQTEAEKTAHEAVTLSIQAVAGLDTKERLQRLKHKPGGLLLAVYGEKDDLIDSFPLRSLNGSTPALRQIGLPDSRHFPMLDEAAKFQRLLKDFLDPHQDLAALTLKEEWRRRMR